MFDQPNPSAIDTARNRFNNDHVLKARFSLILLLGALLGLFGQGMAYAAGPGLAPMIAGSHDAASGAGCAGMVTTEKAVPKHPCKGLTLACIAQMGCVAPLTIVEPMPVMARAGASRLAMSWPRRALLSGLQVAPEPEPPAS